jgi:hypothetical protein
VNVVMNLLEFQCFVDFIFLEYISLLCNWFLVFERYIMPSKYCTSYITVVFLVELPSFKLLFYLHCFLNQKYVSSVA